MNKKKHISKILVSLLLIIICISNTYASNVPNLYSKSAILVDNDSGKVLFENGGNNRVYPASTTKVLTAILALENLDLSSTTVVSKTAVDLPYGSSNAALKQGEVMSIKDILYAMLLVSGNDCANVIAEAVSGSIDKFVILMNDKLKELGCTNSHFANAHGYHDDNHYTTPNDMMKILSYAIKNEEFVKIFSTSSYTIPPTNKTKTERDYQNTNRLILTKKDSYLSRYYEYCVGGKTGYTDEAGRTLVAYAKKGDKNLILGVFNASSAGVQDVRYTDAINLFEYGFNNFEKTKILDKNNYSFSYTDNAKKVIYNYSIPNDVYTLSKVDDNNSVSTVDYVINLDYDKLNEYDITSTDYKNQVVGTINVKFSQNSSNYDKDFELVLNEISELKLPMKDSINLKSILKVVILILLVIILIIISRTILKKRKLKKEKNRKKYVPRNDRSSNTSGNINSKNMVSYRPRRK